MAWDAMLDAAYSAKKSLKIEQYAIDPDDIGTKFVKCFIDKAKEGLDVQLLIDGWGCYNLTKSELYTQMIDAGVKVTIFRPVNFKRLATFSVLPRNHRKMHVYDDEVVFVGGICLYDEIRDWRDTMLEVYDEHIVQQCLAVFSDTCDRADDNMTYGDMPYHKDDEHDMTIYANAPTVKKQRFTHVLHQMIDNAQEHIVLTTPYFAPDDELMSSIKAAAARGIKVDILVSDYAKIGPYTVSKKIARTLIECGTNIYYYTQNMLHLKMMIIDRKWAAIGSCNLDGLSIRQNEEIMLATSRESVVEELFTHYQADLQGCKPFTIADWHNRTIKEKFVGAVCYPFRHYL